MIMEKNKEKVLLYKYRSLKNMTYFLDILINKRLYATTYDKLNDPMEGAYMYNSDIPKEKRKALLDAMKNTLICSLSKHENIGLMWTHYADEGKGCCIEVDVTATSWERREIDCKHGRPILDGNINDILSHKGEVWEYEQEIRYLKQKNSNTSPYLTIDVTKIIVGYKIDKNDYALLKKIVEMVNKIKPKGKNNIEIVKIKKEEVDFGL